MSSLFPGSGTDRDSPHERRPGTRGRRAGGWLQSLVTETANRGGGAGREARGRSLADHCKPWDHRGRATGKPALHSALVWPTLRPP